MFFSVYVCYFSVIYISDIIDIMLSLICHYLYYVLTILLLPKLLYCSVRYLYYVLTFLLLFLVLCCYLKYSYYFGV